MDHAEYVYTVGMSEAEAEEHLRTGSHGILSLADGAEAYAIPLSYHYDGDRFLIRISDHDGDAEKRRFLEATETATFVRYDAAESSSWSVLVRGPIDRWSGDVSEATLAEWFPPFRLFDEAVEDVSFLLYELDTRRVTARRTVD